jgi:hypothetical protein
VLRNVLGLQREEITGDWTKLHNDELHVGTSYQILLVRTNQRGYDGQGIWHEWGRREMHAGFWW